MDCIDKHDWGPVSRRCGVRICKKCGAHKGLARCFCGWNLQPGERLEDDPIDDDYVEEYGEL